MARTRLVPDIIGFIREIIERRFHSDRATPRQLTAHHEAGHAVAAVAFGIGFDYVSVDAERDTSGRIVLDQKPPHLRPGFNPHDPEDRRIAQRPETGTQLVFRPTALVVPLGRPTLRSDRAVKRGQNEAVKRGQNGQSKGVRAVKRGQNDLLTPTRSDCTLGQSKGVRTIY